jgi:hypothetical protein
MITLVELIAETGINRNTLAKYRAVGLVPKPQIVHRGKGKENQPRGNEALYPNYTPWLVREITRLKSKPYNYSLSEIRDKIPRVEELTPKEEVAEPLQSSDGKTVVEAIISMGGRLDKLTPGYKRVLVEYETTDDGTLKVSSIWGVKEKSQSQ